MQISVLPMGAAPRALTFPHFPTPAQAVIWRNWELVDVDRLARVLRTSEAEVTAAAKALGLSVPPKVCPLWLTRGYVTLIRANWHLLPYAQLLELLDWSADRMAYHLKEDDFLWAKLGGLKPDAAPVTWRPLSAEERRRTQTIRDLLRQHFPANDRGIEPPFRFLDTFGTLPERGSAREPTREPAGRGRFHPTFVYSYSALYGDALLDDALDPYPDGLLARYADLGIDGVWLPVILYKMQVFAPLPSLSDGHAKRVAGLNRLVERAARFGLGVYVYLNEPRCLPADVMAQLPEWRGVPSHDGLYNALCTSKPAVREYLREGSATLFRRVPGLAGAFTITMSENLTNCYARFAGKECPLCSQRNPADVIAEVNRLLAEGIHAANPSAEVIVWNWGWAEEWEADAIDRLPADVAFQCTSEWGLPTAVGGVEGFVVDYAISQVGPSPRSRAAWERARRRGLKTLAKVQLNTTWECAPVPFLPVPDLVERHLDNLRETGVDGLMVSWTLGSYPGGNLPLLRTSAAEYAEAAFGPSAAPVIRQAWSAFSHAFQEFPFHVTTLYTGPQNMGPANLLYAEPTGYRAAMVGTPYDNLEDWRAIYPPDVFEAQFAKLCDGWREGLAVLDRAAPRVAPEGRPRFEELQRMARAAYCHFRGACLQVMFVRRRERREEAGVGRELAAILDEEIALAKELHGLVLADACIGFEASNHYAYTANDLREKVINCEWLKQDLIVQAPARSGRSPESIGSSHTSARARKV